MEFSGGFNGWQGTMYQKSNIVVSLVEIVKSELYIKNLMNKFYSVALYNALCEN